MKFGTAGSGSPSRVAFLAAMCPEDLLVTLAVHGSKHMRGRLSWLADIAGLIERTAILDWHHTMGRAMQWHAKRRLLTACALAENLLSTSIPAEYCKEISKHSRSNFSVRRIESHIIYDLETRTMDNFISELRNHAENADKVADRFRIVFSYSKKIMQVDEARMLRSMNDGTKTLYKLSKGLRFILGRLAS